MWVELDERAIGVEGGEHQRGASSRGGSGPTAS
jgi:hypothetical protein